MSTAFLQSVCLSVGVWSVLLGGKPAISSGEPPHHSNSHHCLCPCHLSHRAGQQCSHHHHLPPYPCPSGAFIDLSLWVMNYLFAIMIFSPIYPTVNCLLNDKMLCNIISQWLTNVNGMNMAVGGSLATIWTWYRITTSATLIDIQTWSGHKKIETYSSFDVYLNASSFPFSMNGRPKLSIWTHSTYWYPQPSAHPSPSCFLHPTLPMPLCLPTATSPPRTWWVHIASK